MVVIENTIAIKFIFSGKSDLGEFLTHFEPRSLRRETNKKYLHIDKNVSYTGKSTILQYFYILSLGQPCLVEDMQEDESWGMEKFLHRYAVNLK